MDGAEPFGQPVRPIGEIKPFFRKHQQMAFVGRAYSAACEFNGLCLVLSIVVFFAHGRCGWRRRLRDFGPQWQTANRLLANRFRGCQPNLV